jgi:hypothetical protein
MARKPREFSDSPESADLYSSALPSVVEIVEGDAPLVNQSPILASAVDRDNAARADIAPPPRFRVLDTQYVMSRGGRVLLRAGKIVDEHNFDLAALVSQGVRLAEAN